MIPPLRKVGADDENLGPRGHMGPISADTTGFKVGALTRRMPAIGAELDRDAQVWEVYVDETDRSDRELVKSWNDSLDVLLIFAALFSAITTALVIESSKQLQPDPAETSAQTLQAMSRILIAISNGQPVDSSASFSASTSRFSPSRSSVLVNALWYLSLTLSVAVSLVAMVAKSWCNIFMSNRTGSDMYEQGRRRQRKWNAIETWGMQNVFVYLPTLMHLALRLSVYLWDICISVAAPVLFVTGVFVSLYAVATILPLVHQDCPYSTPLSKPLDKLALLVDWNGFLLRLQKATQVLPQTQQDSRNHIRSPKRQTILKTESTPMDKVTSQMLLWLISNCEDSQLVGIALQSIAGARHGLPVETLAGTDVTKMVVQRLINCVVRDPRTKILRLKSGTSIEAAGLYAQALGRLLESGAGFRSSSEHRVSQLDRKQLSTFFDPHTNESIAELRNLFFPGLGEDDNIATIATSTLTLLCHHSEPTISYWVENLGDRHSYAEIIGFRNDRLVRSYLDGEGATIDDRALLALLEAAPHWIIRRMIAMDNEERSSSIMPLVQLLRSSSCSGPDFQYAIGLSLTVAAVLMCDYPGWEHPLNSIEDRATRAIEVYRYYKVEHHEEPKVLVVSGLLGLLRAVPQMPTTFSKDEVTVLTDVLTQIDDVCPMAGFCLHTLPETLTIAQNAETTWLETLQAVADGRSGFGETFLIPCLMQLLHNLDALGDLNMYKDDLTALSGGQSSSLRRRACSNLLFKHHWRLHYSLEHLEPAQTSMMLLDISVGDDAYSAPAAMACLWQFIKRLIEAANETPDGPPATVLADMLKHDALTSLRAKAPDLPISPRNMFEVSSAEMWYPLLKEMRSHKYAASVVGKSTILTYMHISDGSTVAVPYLEELRDGRSWFDILGALKHMSSCDVEA
ncbi:hypothetical protein FRC12_001207 [Ceratobasidium sp. 428]|nr:hypothetical protein FRC12_001207 [Ceratobasidium sp. 428]